MKKLAAGLAAALMVAVGANVYQAVPDKASAPKRSYAYQRVELMFKSLAAGDDVTACKVLAWYSLNNSVPESACREIMASEFPKGKVAYRVVGEEHGSSPHYIVVTAIVATDDPATKNVDESAFCEAQWSAGKDCKYAGTYTFGVALYPSPEDAFANKKKPVLHWYVMWVD